MYLKCVRGRATIDIYDDGNVHIYICRGYNKFIHDGWNVYDSANKLVINYNVDNPIYAFFKRIKYICSIRIEDKPIFNLTSRRNWKTFPLTTEFRTVGLEDNIYTMYFQHFTSSPIVIRNAQNDIVAEFGYKGFEYFDHTYTINYENMDPKIVIAMYLLLEMEHPVGFFDKG